MYNQFKIDYKLSLDDLDINKDNFEVVLFDAKRSIEDLYLKALALNVENVYIVLYGVLGKEILFEIVQRGKEQIDITFYYGLLARIGDIELNCEDWKTVSIGVMDLNVTGYRRVNGDFHISKVRYRNSKEFVTFFSGYIDEFYTSLYKLDEPVYLGNVNRFLATNINSNLDSGLYIGDIGSFMCVISEDMAKNKELYEWINEHIERMDGVCVELDVSIHNALFDDILQIITDLFSLFECKSASQQFIKYLNIINRIDNKDNIVNCLGDMINWRNK